ncbi:MAG: ribose-phosphate diphosphokinase [Candidatus Heimdallarchaeaceae archaeon]
MKLVAAPASKELGEKIANIMKIPLLNIEFHEFYDGETYLRVIEDVQDEEIIVVQSTYYPQEKHLLQLMLVSSTLKDLGVKKIYAIIPYLCYARADKRKLSGEALSHQITLQMIENAGIDVLITVNVHNKDAFLESKNLMEKYTLSCFCYLAAELQKKEKRDWYIVAPDVGRKEDAKEVAKTLSCNFTTLQKTRDPITKEVRFEKSQIFCENKDVIILDDVITSGGTAKKAAQLVLQENPASVIMLFIHTLANIDVIEELLNLGVEKIVTTNSVLAKGVVQIDISSFISKFIEEKFL